MDKVFRRVKSDVRSVLLILFIPSADRDGKTVGSQDAWKAKALDFFCETYGGATAMPRAEGIWRDEQNGGKPVRDFPVLVHCYAKEDQVQDQKREAKLASFCKSMGKEMNQGEVALVIDGQYHGIQDFG